MADAIGANLARSKRPMGGHRGTNKVTTSIFICYPGFLDFSKTSKKQKLAQKELKRVKT